jgi:hypothetical protein
MGLKMDGTHEAGRQTRRKARDNAVTRGYATKGPTVIRFQPSTPLIKGCMISLNKEK